MNIPPWPQLNDLELVDLDIVMMYLYAHNQVPSPSSVFLIQDKEILEQVDELDKLDRILFNYSLTQAQKTF